MLYHVIVMIILRKTLFSDNQKNRYEFNELKSFNLDAQGSLIKLSFQKPHENDHNTNFQV